MGDDHRRAYPKKVTGTVPKIKCRNNPISNRNEAHQNILSNDLGLVDFSNLARNSRRTLTPSNYTSTMSSTFSDEQNSFSRINGMSTNGGVTPTISGSNSRRDSVGNVPKCDNVSKYPDKRQIEDKLNQIREYIRVTSSLMSTMKNTDDQLLKLSFTQSGEENESENMLHMLKDLKDSEKKLLVLLEEAEEYVDNENNDKMDNSDETIENGVDSISESGYISNNSQKNDLEQRVEYASQELQMLCDQHNTLLSLKHKAENKIRDARQVQERLLSAQKVQNQRQNLEHDSNLSNKNLLERDYDEQSINSAIFTENLHAQVNMLQERLNMLHSTNHDTRNELIQVLDKRDAQMRSEHMQLREKLHELQNKKLQVDRLVSQLQNLEENTEGDEIGAQVRKICTMKEQLSKLKDMYELVKSTESALESQNVNDDSDSEENAQALPVKADNVIQNYMRTNSSNVLQPDNISSNRLALNQHREKQINKSDKEQLLMLRSGARPKVSAENERIRLQAELQAKKRELEEIMCKHKAGTSNLNHDVGGENKSDFSNALFEGVSTSWYPVIPSQHNRATSSDRYSSDDCLEDDVNEYVELNDMNNPHQQTQYVTNNTSKPREESELRPDVNQPADFDRFRNLSLRTPERSTSIGTSVRQPDTPNSVLKPDNKSQIQKQLELIRSVCDSLLEQQTNSSQQNVPHFRNNLTPSPLYSEVTQYPSISVNTLNNANMSLMNHPGEAQNYVQGEAASYQSLLATNALQTQAFMLNTLNQCCQMLWLQQRELIALRNNVNVLQERYDRNPPQPSYVETIPLLYAPAANQPSSVPHLQVNTQKANQVSAACSLPNLNHDPHTNTESSFAHHQPNNIQAAARLLGESNLNNAAAATPMHPHHHHVNNTAMHPPLTSQIWNGQALNNQVAPGNRANNYWDNFRSYSRQNLLSTTKSNEGLQNSTVPLERFNNSSERTSASFILPAASVPKLSTRYFNRSPSPPPEESDIIPRTEARHFNRPSNVPPEIPEEFNRTLDATETQQLNFNRPAAVRSQAALKTTPVCAVPPPDVLNINQNQKQNETPSESRGFPTLSSDSGASFGRPVNLREFDCLEGTSVRSNIPDGYGYKADSNKSRNEWTDDGQNEQVPKSKLFEELRENVYKEVASLISANQGRPHFLIQLFRDLHFISSDPLRWQTLQSIQTLITSNQQLSDCDTGAEVHRNSQRFKRHNLRNGDQDLAGFLEAHNDEVLQPNLLDTVRELFIASNPLFDVSDKGNCQDSPLSALNEALRSLRGQKVSDVKVQLLKILGAIALGDFEFVQESSESDNTESKVDVASNDVSVSYDTPLFGSGANTEEKQPQMQNDDLAEADQSHITEMDIEEEGAVGGIFNVVGSSLQVAANDMELTLLDYGAESEFGEQGLDQVPTRLTTNSNSRSNTPNKERNAAKSNPSEHF